MTQQSVHAKHHEASTALVEAAGKYLTFKLGREEYGLEILKVQEIIGMMPVTSVPRAPACVRGVVNLRGKVIPVIDLRSKFDMKGHEDTEKTCIIVAQVSRGGETVTMGIIVDEVSEVLDIESEQIEAAPEFGAGAKTGFILGIGKVGDKVILLLDIDKALSDDDLEHAIETAA